MRKKKLIPLILTSAACFALSFAFIGNGAKQTTAEESTPDLSLSSFQMYNGSQIRLPVNSGNINHADNSLRFMALIQKEQYEAFEEAYGEGAKKDTTEWGVLFATRSKVEQYDLNAENCFGGKGTQVYGWNAPTGEYDAELSTPEIETWATDELRTDGTVGMFTPVRYDNLEGLSLAGEKGEEYLINGNLSLDGQAGTGYYIISGALLLPDTHYNTEIVGRAYVRYLDDKGTVDTTDDEYVYKFADYAGGHMDNNARSMAYVAQKYLESDEKKADGDKVYVDETPNAVSQYINDSLTVGYTVEYHFQDADGKSIVRSLAVANSDHTLNSNIEMSAYEIIEMCNEAELQALMEEYGAEIDWYNPFKVETLKGYANGRTVFKLYYDNEDYVSAKNGYDMLADAGTRAEALASSHQKADETWGEEQSTVQYDKQYALHDEPYMPTVCAEEHESGCKHVCDKVYCSSPYHNHASQYLKTELNNNVLQVEARLQDENGNYVGMNLDENGNWVSGFNFADYEYVLIRIYSNIGGMKMGLITGSNKGSVTTCGDYEIKQGWNRIKISGKMIQDAIETYVQAGGYLETVNGGTFAPYRDGRYLQFFVSNNEATPFTAWELYLDDVIGVYTTEKKWSVGYGDFEHFTEEDVENVYVAHVVASLNTDARYAYTGKQSLKLVDNRHNIPEESLNPDTAQYGTYEQQRANEWTAVKLKLYKDGKPVTLAQLAQMEISFNVYCTHDLMLWFGGCMWTDSQPMKLNDWNTIRFNGWRMVDAILNIDKRTETTYDETTGDMVLYFLVGEYNVGATYYVDNIQANYVTEKDQVVELDDFTTLPARSDALSTPVWINNVYSIAEGGYANTSSPSEIANYPYWHAIPEHQADVEQDNPNVEYWYEIKVNNGTTYAQTTVDAQDNIVTEVNVSYGWEVFSTSAAGYVAGFFDRDEKFNIIQTRGYDTFAVRAVERTTVADGEYTYRYSDWAYYDNSVRDVADDDDGKIVADFWSYYVENDKTAQSSGKKGAFAVPEVTISQNGVATWNEVAGAINGYAYKINNGEAVEFWKKPRVTLQDGDSISVRVMIAEATNANGDFVDINGKEVDDASLVAHTGASAWSMPIVYHEGVSGKLTIVKEQEKDENGNVISVQKEKGKTIYDIAAMKGDIFKSSTRIPSPASGGGYAWKIVLGDKQTNGIFFLPLTISGQPLTNQQLLAAEYIELSIYAGAQNNETGAISFNGKNTQTLLPGQWNSVRIPTRTIYQEVQNYYKQLDEGATNADNPYSNGRSKNSNERLTRLCGYGLFEVSNGKEDDYWIVDSARLVFSDGPTYATNGSYWFTQHDYNTMPITAYNALMPSNGTITDNEGLLDVFAKYNIDYDKLIEAYVNSGINTMMGLYDYANFTPEGYNFVVEMLEKCAENDLAYLVRWAGSENLTVDEVQSESYATMRNWMQELASYSALAGVMLVDEPGASAFSLAVKGREAIEHYWGEDALYHVNLFGSYVSHDAMLNYRKPANSKGWLDTSYTYEDYVNEFIKIYQPQVLSFDFYPIIGMDSILLNDCGKMAGKLETNGTYKPNTDGKYVTQGAASMKFTLPTGTYVNVGTGLATEAAFDAYTAITFDVYNEGAAVTLKWHSGADLSLANGWNHVTVPTSEYSLIAGNSGGYIWIRNLTGSDVTIYIDNVRGVTADTNSYLREGYFENLALIREKAIEANIPFWSYIQTCAWDEGGALPTESELLWNVNTTLAYGAKGIEYFCGVNPPSSNGVEGGEVFSGSLFDEKGQPTGIYASAQKANMQIQSIDHILMNAKSMGVMFAGTLPQFYNVSGGYPYMPLSAAENLAQIPTRGTLTSFRECWQIEGNLLVGCFDYNGKTVLYVVNNSTKDNDISLENNYARLYFTQGYQTSGKVYSTSETAFINLVDRNEATINNTLINGTKDFTGDYANSLLIRGLKPGEAVLVEVGETV